MRSLRHGADRLLSLTIPVLGLAAFFALWELLVAVLDVEAFVLPPPSRILSTILEAPRFFAEQAWVTGREALMAMGLALAVAILVAVPMAKWHRVERGVQPVATMVQVIPLVAYAPAFVIWLGPGTRPIVAVAALIAVVPLIFNLVAGLHSADPDAREVLLSAGASSWELFRYLDLPSALPALFAGLRIAVGLTLIGAVLGEWFALVSEGLGVQIRRGQAQSQADLVWASAFVLGAVGGIGLLAVNGLERLLTGPSRRR
jgi:NitT/TauT family transport system permease protein